MAMFFTFKLKKCPQLLVKGCLMDGIRIKRAREFAGLSQGEFAEALGVSQPVLSRWERSNQNITSNNVKSIHEITGVSYEYLFGDSFEVSRLGFEELEIVELYNKLSAKDRERVAEFCRALKITERKLSGTILGHQQS